MFQGTLVYGLGDKEVGEIDHLLIEKVSGRVVYAVISFGGPTSYRAGA
jgi:PRC-barrel domain protein